MTGVLNKSKQYTRPASTQRDLSIFKQLKQSTKLYNVVRDTSRRASRGTVKRFINNRGYSDVLALTGDNIPEEVRNGLTTARFLDQVTRCPLIEKMIASVDWNRLAVRGSLPYKC